MATMKDCEVCTKPCPQAEMAHENGMARYYATQEFINLQKKVDAGQLVEVVRCKDCEHCMDATSWYNGYDKLCRIWGRSFQPVKNDDFCSHGKKKEGADNV